MSEYERGRRDEAILWREAIFTGTSADLMAWIKKRWAELEAAPADETLPAGAATSEQSAPLLKCCCQPIHANNCPFHDARSSQYRHFFAHEAAQPSGAQGEGLRKALERLRDKWVQNSKGQSDSEYTSGMDYQSGVCADELNAALAAARRGS